MKRIYEAANALEAQILKDLLHSQGIEAHIEGQYLSGAAGELPVAGVVGISVTEGDVESALDILKAWESEQVDSEEEKPKSKTKSVSGYFLLGACLGGLAVFMVYQLPERVVSNDYNLDGNIDSKYIYKHNRLSKAEFDDNSDGKVDGVYLYNRYGEITSAKFDNDFDGSFETSIKYYLGLAFDETSDTNGDGKIDRKYEYEDGRLILSKIISPETKKVKKTYYYYHGKLVKSEFDTNDDGIFDKVVEYDFYEEPIITK